MADKKDRKVEGIQYRAFDATDGELNEESRTIRFSAVSDAPVEMWFGNEVLSHARGAMRNGTRQKALPLLFNHNSNRLLGVVEKIEQDDHKTYVTVRFAKTEDGNWAFEQVKDRVLVNVSCGYRVFSWDKPQENLRRATDWEIYEVSLVTMPADPSVGVDRSFNLNHNEGDVMDEEEKKAAEKAVETRAVPQSAPQPHVQVVDADKVRSAERARIQAIETMCRDFNVTDDRRNALINDGRSLDEARAAIMEDLRSRNVSGTSDPRSGVAQDMNLGLTPSEKRNYSICRALNASINGDWRKAGFEREVSMELSKRMGRETNGFFMPTDIGMSERAAGDYVVGTATQGGNLVETELLAGSFIEALRAKAMVTRLGATMIPGLVGNVEIPRQTGVSSVQWISETGSVNKSGATFDKVPLKMKTIAAKSFVSRNMLMQSSIGVEAFVRRELITSIAMGIDLAALSGSGADGEPLGVANQAGIHQLSGGENGAPIDFDLLIEMETLVADSNADVSTMAYLANAVTIGALKKIKDGNKNYIWKTVTDMVKNGMPGEVNGYPVARSNQVRKDLTKGTATGCSELFFGNWGDLVIGEWGVVELLPNPYSATAYDNGGVEIRALQSIDVAVRHPESFCVISDIVNA